jgi:hypothetical protein
MAIRRGSNPQRPSLKENPMKTVLISLALILATAAPSLAVEFNNSTVHAFTR